MQRVNDDMDDLYRKAAENYPLNTDTSDWEKLRKKLADNSDETPVASAPGKKNNYRALLLLLLLLPAGFLGYKYFGRSNTPIQQPVATHPDVVNNNSKISGTNNSGTSVDKVIEKTSLTRSAINPNGSVKQQIPKQTLRQVDKGSIKLNTFQNTSTVADQPSYVEPDRSNNSAITPTKRMEEQPTLSIQKDQPVAVDINKPGDNITEKKSTEEKKSETSPENSDNKKPVNKLTKERFFYAGLIVAPDVSMVKFQSVKNTGINFGVLVGYRINKKLSIESGVMADKKYYYSDGKYFNTDKIHLPGTAKITMLNGNCKMIEVPFNLKYNLRPPAKMNLFTSVGLSSYFMKKENYDYTIIYSSGVPYQRSSTYNTEATQLFCVANVSAGFEHRLINSTAIRFEPYVKIPLKGIGIGSLPITSTGINIVITKKLF